MKAVKRILEKVTGLPYFFTQQTPIGFKIYSDMESCLEGR